MNLVNPLIRQQMQDASWIRRMFDAGLELKQRVGAGNVFDFSLGNPDVPPPAAAGHVILTCGAAGGLVTFFRAVLEPGDQVLCFAPYFVEYGAYAGHFGGELVAVRPAGPDFQPDLAALERAIWPRTRAVIVNSPNNPTGCVYDAATLAALGEILERANAGRDRPIFLVSDEPY